MKIFALSPRKWWRFLRKKWLNAKRPTARAASLGAASPAAATNLTNFPPLEGPKREKFILRSADAFYDISQRALQLAAAHPDQEFYLGLVYGVNCAIATELYLKCLLTVEGSQIPKVHNLKYLFNQVSRESRGKIRRRHNRLAKKHPGLSNFRKIGIKTDLDSLLEDGQDVFKLFRYLFEGIPNRMQPVGFALELFGHIIRNRILDLRPKWLSDESTSPAH